MGLPLTQDLPLSTVQTKHHCIQVAAHIHDSRCTLFFTSVSEVGMMTNCNACTYTSVKACWAKNRISWVQNTLSWNYILRKMFSNVAGSPSRRTLRRNKYVLPSFVLLCLSIHCGSWGQASSLTEYMTLFQGLPAHFPKDFPACVRDLITAWRKLRDCDVAPPQWAPGQLRLRRSTGYLANPPRSGDMDCYVFLN